MLEEVGPETAISFPNVSLLASAFTVGELYRDQTICQWLFPCYRPQVQGIRNEDVILDNGA